MFREFSKQQERGSPIQTEMQLVGSLAGFFSTLVPNVQLTADYLLDSKKTDRADVLFAYGLEKVLVELKRAHARDPRVVLEGIDKLEHYMLLSGIKQAVLFVYPPSGGDVIVEERPVRGLDGRIVILRPATATARPSSPTLPP